MKSTMKSFLNFAIDNLDELIPYIINGNLNIRIHRDITGEMWVGGGLTLTLKVVQITGAGQPLHSTFSFVIVLTDKLLLKIVSDEYLRGTTFVAALPRYDIISYRLLPEYSSNLSKRHSIGPLNNSLRKEVLSPICLASCKLPVRI